MGSSGWNAMQRLILSILMAVALWFGWMTYRERRDWPDGTGRPDPAWHAAINALR